MNLFLKILYAKISVKKSDLENERLKEKKSSGIHLLVFKTF